MDIRDNIVTQSPGESTTILLGVIGYFVSQQLGMDKASTAQLLLGLSVVPAVVKGIVQYFRRK